MTMHIFHPNNYYIKCQLPTNSTEQRQHNHSQARDERRSVASPTSASCDDRTILRLGLDVTDGSNLTPILTNPELAFIVFACGLMYLVSFAGTLFGADIETWPGT